MKFRRIIAKLLVIVVVMELILTNINRNENLVMAATDEVVQSEEAVENTVESPEGNAAALSEESTKSTTEQVTEEAEENTDKEETEEVEETATEEESDVAENASEEENSQDEGSTSGEETSQGQETTSEEQSSQSGENTSKEISQGAAQQIVESASESTQEEEAEILDPVQGNIPQLYADTIELGTSSIPTTIAGLENSDAKTYYISNYQGWLNLQALSKVSSLEGYTFQILVRREGESDIANYDFVELNNSLSDSKFEGLGTADTPFRGTLYTNYDTGISLRTENSLFQYLSTDASVYELLVEPEGACAGLATNLIVESEQFGKFNNIIISDDGSGITGDVAGGLFAQVVNESGAPFVLQGSNVEIEAPVSGEIAGGLIGSMTGGITMVMDGGIQWSPSVEAASTSSILGGWIGKIDANNQAVTISSGSEAGVVYNFQGVRSTMAHTSGGIFGSIENAQISVENQLTFNLSDTSSGYDLAGVNAGTFAGVIDNSDIIVKANLKVAYVRLKLGQNSDTEKGVGGFVGVIKDSTIDSEVNGNIEISGVYVQNDTGLTTVHNIGGIAGYAKNTYFTFSQASCTVKNFTSKKTYGNAGGAIGLYVGTEEENSSVQGTILQRVSVTGTTTISAISGCTGGLVGRMNLTDCDVTVEQCYGQNLCYSTTNNLSLGIGAVVSDDSKAKLHITNVVLVGNITKNSSSSGIFGGMVGYADVDLEIAGNLDESGRFDTAVYYLFTGSKHDLSSMGGLVGVISQNGTRYREADISNVLVGCPSYSYYGESSIYGGLIAKVQDRTSVCLDGKIYLDGGYAVNWTGTETEVKSQVNCQGKTSFGSVVGSQNYSLIYLQPTGDLQVSSQHNLDEIANYGGIFRNGNWVPDDKNDSSKWLIQEHQVTGVWKYIGWDNVKGVCKLKIETIGDFMRLAIFGNTNNQTTDSTTGAAWGDGFFPLEVEGEGVSGDLGRTDVFYAILMADFYVEPGTYDLTNTGIVSLYRNDELGTNGGTDNENKTRYATSQVKNSLICEDESGATIKYQLINYSHANIGLFPCVNGYVDYQTTKLVEFRNLNLDYTYTFDPMKYGGSNNIWLDKSIKQYVGGLAGKATYDIEVSNVSYTGTVDDNKAPASYARYIGGLFGLYEGVAGRSLTIQNLEADFNCTYSYKNNTVGGVIALVNTPSSGTIDISLDQVNVSGSIVAESTSTTVALKESGMITTIYSSSTKGIYANLNLSNVSVDDFSLSTTKLSLAFPSIGGFLGYSWSCVNAELSDIAIGEQGAASICAKSNFGGLVHDVRGVMSITNMSYGANTSFDTNGAAGECCGLLVRNGQYLYLDVSGYTIDNGVTLNNYTSVWFDELVGFNKGGDDDEHGGIVTIHRTDGTSCLGRAGADYSSYEYGFHVKDETGAFVKKTNYYTRYYYDLDQLDYSVDYVYIDSPEDLMVWHLMHYANDYVIDYCMKSISGSLAYSADNLPSTYYLSGNIDMTGYSIYPTSLLKNESYSGTGAVIKFNAQAIFDGENTIKAGNADFVEKFPKDYTSQHYQMHAGLFNNIWNGADIAGLTLTGTYSLTDYGDNFYTAGALVCGNIYGVEDGLDSQGQQLYQDVKTNFNNIVLKDLWCVSSEGKLKESGSVTLSNPIGLMVAGIASGAKVNMDGISMTGYDDDEVGVVGYKAASALIGMVGSEDATYISLTFKNLDIMDAAAGMSDSDLRSSAGEEALARASLIYYYNYKENCSAIYTFTSEDYLVGKLGAKKLEDYEDDGVVTLGQELGNQDYDGKNYAEILYYDNEDPVGMASDRVDENGTEYSAGVDEIAFDCNNYLPYVFYRLQDILVNPKIADIEEGCGTYEDPYIISSTVQFITIYRYLYEEDLYKEVLGMAGNEWKMHATGDDSYLCNGTESSDADSEGHGELIAYEKERSADSNFPTQEELSQAYYMITADIDLSKYPEFVGFGREEMPFVGVIIGNDEGAVPTISMLESSSSNSLSQYALIQVAKGAVLKDLTIAFHSTINIDSETGGIGAGVIATVLGGDNIIDNVTVTAPEGVDCFLAKKEAALIGGYVGVVELGGVILRNLSTDSLSGFSVSVADEQADYPYIGSIVGRVLDGYVVYDNEEESDTELLSEMEIASTLTEGELPLCSTYDIINGAYLDSSDSKIQWTGSGFDIADNKQLQIISMALNSGMLNYGYAAGYDSSSRQRNGNYEYVKGQEYGDVFLETYQDIISGDNKTEFADSYLWQYFKDASSIGNMLKEANATSEQAGLNPIAAYNGISMRTYTLTGSEYDMTVFKMAFRGLGARYHCTEYSSSNDLNYRVTDISLFFKGNLVGSSAENPAHIILDMRVTKEMDSYRAGLLNEVPHTTNVSAREISIQNITLSGSVVNEGYSVELDSSGNYYTPVVSYNAGGFISETLTPTRFENVNLEDLTVEATGNAGGLIGQVREFISSDVSAQEITLNNLTVIGGADSTVLTDLESGELGIINGYAGGLIGKFRCGGSMGSKIYIGTTDGTDKDSTSGVTGDNVTVYTRGRSSAAGGVIGNLDPSSQTANSTYIYNSSMKNLKVYTKNAYHSYSNDNAACAGGIIGSAKHGKIWMYNVTVGSTQVNESVEIALKGLNITEDPDVVVNCTNTLNGVGGMVGYYYGNGSALNMESCQVLGVLEETGSGSTVIQGYNNAGGMIGLADIGMVYNSSVEGVYIRGIYRAGGCVGAINTAYSQFALDTVTVSGCHLELTNPLNGWDVSSSAGDIGGLVGVVLNNSWDVYTTIGNCCVENSLIASDYTRSAGGFVGRVSQRVAMYSYEDENGVMGENTVTNNVICGDMAGGVFGNYEAGNSSSGMANIKVSNNCIVACVCEDISWRTRKYLAGGFAAEINTSASLGAVENLIIENNLIAVSNDSNSSYVGGVVGGSNANASFYNVDLKNNYMGILEDYALMQKANTAWDIVHKEDLITKDSIKLKQYLKETDIEELKEMLCTKTAIIATDDDLIPISTLTDLDVADIYQYSYGQGAVAGKIYASTTRKNTVIGLNVQYDDEAYRPATDVGMSAIVSSTSEMYEKYRQQYFIVYDSMDTEEPMSDEEYFGFSNLELIYGDYLNDQVDRRYAYRLDGNYLAGAFSDVSIGTIYEETYCKDGNYISDFEDEDGNILPMVIFRTTDNGSLDDIIQTYINILTNNSGAINTYSHQGISVTTTRKLLVDGVLIDDTSTQASVQVVQNGNQYEFVNEVDGTRLYDKMTDESNVSFTVIQISYTYNDETKWALEIPVYVEQELEFDSHMRFTKGIQYNVNTVKAGFSCEADSEKSTGLDIGESYTLYLEYVYGEARTRYPNAVIPKQLYMKSDNEQKSVSFMVGTQMTLIDLEDGGKPYYYTVEASDGSKIDFSKFKDSENNSYTAKNINECTEYVGDSTFTDVCSVEKKNVAVESYLLLVDTSNVTKEEKTRGNALYGLHTDISQLEETNARLYNRIDYIEHCIVRLSETMGMSTEFTDNCTLKGEISEDGSIALTLEYSVFLSEVWKSANEGNSVYLDLAVGLEKSVNGSTQRVALPAGTQVYFEKQIEDEDGNQTFERSEAVYVVHGSGVSDVYYYADSDSALDIMQLAAGETHKTTVKIILDFATADMSAFENTADGESYGITADLLIGTDKDNPVNSEVRDSFHGSVVVNIVSELGFALQPDELITLGINRYQPGETDTGILPFTAKIAFPEDYQSDDVKSKYYGIVYMLEEKTTRQEGITKPEYDTYTGANIGLYKGSDVESGDVIGTTLQNGIKYYYCSLGSDSLSITGNVAEVSFVLEAKEGLDFSNYRITGYLIISDSPITDPISEVMSNGDLNSDFFVYTVANIKTDLN